MKLFKLKNFMFVFTPLALSFFLMLVYGLDKSPLVFMTALVALLISFIVANNVANKKTRNERLKYIQYYKFPEIVSRKFLVEHKYLKLDQVEQVENALKQFFMAYALTKDGGKKPKDGFMMPSRIADELWHHFMLDSENYEKFCNKAYGQMLHHKPGADNGGNKLLRYMKSFPKSIKNTHEYIEKLKEYGAYNALGGFAVLFAIDAYFKIPNGYYYDLETMNNIALAQTASSSSSSDSGGACGGLLASDTKGSCSSGGDCSGGGCGGGCGD